MRVTHLQSHRLKQQTNETLTRCPAAPPPAASSGLEPCGPARWLSGRATAPPCGEAEHCSNMQTVAQHNFLHFLKVKQTQDAEILFFMQLYTSMCESTPHLTAADPF